ncbi:MAG: hypothetical protein RIR01_671 [Bacteroidota bacterium]|jgi:hypothetical protein
MENYFQPVRPNVMRCARFWRNQSLRGDLMDKGGSFNIDLYLRYLEAINEQIQRPIVNRVNSNLIQK